MNNVVDPIRGFLYLLPNKTYVSCYGLGKSEEFLSLFLMENEFALCDDGSVLPSGNFPLLFVDNVNTLGSHC